MELATVLAVFFAALASLAALRTVALTRRMWEDQRRAVKGDRLVKVTECVVRAGADMINGGMWGKYSRARLGAVLASVYSEDPMLFDCLEKCRELRDLKSDAGAQEITKEALREIEVAFSKLT